MTQRSMVELAVVSPSEQRVRELVDEFKLAFRRTLNLAVDLGYALEAHKTTLPHGEWLPWLESDFELGRRMAQNCMNLARNAQRVAYLPPETSIRAALKWLLHQNRAGSFPRALPEPGSRGPSSSPLLRFCQADLPTATIVALILRVFFPDADDALDCTYGSGNFWDGSAHVRVAAAHDADPARGLHGVADFRQLPYDDASFDVALFDPPHLADGGVDSEMATRFGTYRSEELPVVIADGCREAWRVARLGVVVKVTDHVHGQRFVRESGWVIGQLGEPFDVVHQTRSRAFIDPKWGEQLSAYNNGSTFLVFRKDGPMHRSR